MHQLYDYFDYPEVPYIILKNPNGEELYSLGIAYNTSMQYRFNAVSDFSFEYPESIDNGETTLEAYSYLNNKRIVEVENFGNFIITNVAENNTGAVPTKKVECKSLEFELNRKRINAYEVVSINMVTLFAFLNGLNTNWTFDTTGISATMLTKNRGFNVSNTNIYDFLMNDAEKAYEVVFLFDTINKVVTFMEIENITGKVLSVADDNLTPQRTSQRISLITSDWQAVGQSFTATGTDIELDRVKFRLTRHGVPTGYGYAKIYAYTGTPGVDAKPFGDPLAVSQPVDMTTNMWNPQGIAWPGFHFVGENRIHLDSDSSYIVVFEYPKAEADYITIGVSGNHNGNISYYYGGSWRTYPLDGGGNAPDIDLMFYVYGMMGRAPTTDIYLSFDNLIENSTFSENSDEICTAMYCYGNGGLDVNDVNPTGTSVLYNFSYYETTDWMTQSLIDALNAWEVIYSNLQPGYKNYTLALRDYYSQLATLNGEMATLEGQMASLVQTRATIVYLGESLTQIDADIASQQGAIDSKQAEIDTINNVNIPNLLTQMETINNEVAFTNLSHFTTEQFNELKNFIIENIYTNDYLIITDIYTNQQIIDEAQKLYEQSVNVLKKLSQPRYEFEIKMANFMAIRDFHTFTEQLDLGCTVTAEIKEGVQIITALLEISISFDNPEDFSLKFSNRLRLSGDDFIYSDLLSGAFSSN